MNSKIDIRDILPAVQCPTLVLHRPDDRDARIEEGLYLAEHIPGSRFVELPPVRPRTLGRGESDPGYRGEFLTGSRPARFPNRVLATILFTDIVSSTDRLRELGDSAMDCAPRTAPFRGSARARRLLGVRRSGRRAMASSRSSMGRAGRSAAPWRFASRWPCWGSKFARESHGRGRADGGTWGHCGPSRGSRARRGGLGEILVTQTTRDLVEGSGLLFEGRGARELKGIRRRAYAVRRRLSMTFIRHSRTLAQASQLPGWWLAGRQGAWRNAMVRIPLLGSMLLATSSKP